MAKVKPSIVSVKGKLGNKIITKSRYGETARMAPEENEKKKHETALQKQYRRTKLLNKIGSDLNNAMLLYSPNLKSKLFYHNMLRRFRSEPLDNRWFLLKSLEDLDIHHEYTLHKLCTPEIEPSQVKGKIEVRIKTPAYPQPGRYHADCFCYELLLMTWDKSNKAPKSIFKPGAWIYFTEQKMPIFNFKFPISPSTIHWLLFVGVQLGANDKEIGNKATGGMQIMHAGTFDENEEKFYNERPKEEVKIRRYNEKDFLERVQPEDSE